jgi:hypothetical protein
MHMPVPATEGVIGGGYGGCFNGPLSHWPAWFLAAFEIMIGNVLISSLDMSSEV